jgi:hypothetical protein
VLADFSEARTADLYLRYSQPFSLQFASTSNATTPSPRQSLHVSNGEFVQHPSGGTRRPSAAEISASPCVEFDSYLAIDTDSTAATKQIQTLQVFWTDMLEGVWVVSGFAQTSAEPATKNPTKFPGDPDGYYVRVARFSASHGASITGVMEAGIVMAGAATTTQAQITVPDCPTCFEPSGN